MNSKLLFAGGALVAVALVSEGEFTRGSTGQPGSIALAEQPVTQTHRVGDRAVGGRVAGSKGDRVFSTLALEAVNSIDRSLIQLRPFVREEQGPRGKEFQQLAAKATQLNERARQQLEAGNTFEALDLVLQANHKVDALRGKFERE